MQTVESAIHSRKDTKITAGAARQMDLVGGVPALQHGLQCVDVVSMLAEQVPQGYRLLLSKDPPRAPYELQTSAKETQLRRAGEVAALRNGGEQHSKRKLGDDDSAESCTARTVADVIQQAVQTLSSRHAAEEDPTCCRRLYIASSDKPTNGARAISWPAISRQEADRRDALHDMRRAWDQRTGASPAGGDPDNASDVVLTGATASYTARDLVSRLVQNETDAMQWIDVKSEDIETHDGAHDHPTKMYLPARSAFLVTDLLPKPGSGQAHCLPEGWPSVVSHAKEHPPSLILLDPPYPNYSAKRLKRARETYSSLHDLYDLWRLVEPVKALLAAARDRIPPLVACWVTNDPKAQRFVLIKLFPAWHLEHIGELVWLKTTTDFSKPVLPLDNAQGRKPYEILLLGRRRNQDSRALTSYIANSTPPTTRIFACAPFGHSRKPPTLSMLQPWLAAADPLNVYELFARSVSPGPGTHGHYISIGNEPCLFNQVGVGIVEHESVKDSV